MKRCIWNLKIIFLSGMMAKVEDIYLLYEKSGQTVCTDTRKIAAGSLFFALKGGNFNGNLFAKKALENGAKYAVVDERHFDDERIILVEDALKCLQDLATLHRRKSHAKVLGIGGSNGKTTTKELLVSVLSTSLNTHYTHGNLNNHIGVPLTLLQLRPEHEVAVVELGANREGDIEELCLIAEPGLGIITNIGKEHLEGFGGMEGVARAESELFDYLHRHNGHAFVNMDDKWLGNMGRRLTNKTGYSIDLDGMSNLHTVPSISFEYKGETVNSVLMGEHNFQNMAATIAIAEYFGIKPAGIRKGLESYVPANNRSQVIHTAKGNTVLLDAYNANPSSVEVAMKTFGKMDGPKIVLLGDMFELGSYEHEEHENIAALCAGAGYKACYLVGNAFNKTESAGPHLHKFAAKDQAMEAIRIMKYENVMVLIKGSRGMKMEDFLDEF
jgi:UDP-N-acetylmuramoyl-tripeptide--D-alanyl-D-alanine ligase